MKTWIPFQDGEMYMVGSNTISADNISMIAPLV